MKLTRTLKSDLRKTVSLMYGKEWFHPSDVSGVVIAGIGESEPFPECGGFGDWPVAMPTRLLGAGMGGLAERRLAHVWAKKLDNASLAVSQNLRPGHLASSRR